MIPPIFSILNASAPVKSLLGSKPLRFFPWSDAPQNVSKPYATYGVFNGNPINYIDRVPDMDNLGTQVDVWASTTQSCIDVATAIRDALEPHAHMISTQSYERDSETKLFRCRMDFNFFTGRS